MTRWWRVMSAATIASTVFAGNSAVGFAGVPVVTEKTVRQAKSGLLWFLQDNVDRPQHVSDACPLISRPAISGHLGRLGLTASERNLTVEVVFDPEPGSGVVAVRCGVDLTASADPPGSTELAVDALVLDGQATFPQYAVGLFGRDVVVSDVIEPAPGEIASNCTDGGCAAALDLSGLTFVAHLSGLPAGDAEQVARQLVWSVAPEFIANLGAISAAST